MRRGASWYPSAVRLHHVYDNGPATFLIQRGMNIFLSLANSLTGSPRTQEATSEGGTRAKYSTTARASPIRAGHKRYPDDPGPLTLLHQHMRLDANTYNQTYGVQCILEGRNMLPYQ